MSQPVHIEYPVDLSAPDISAYRKGNTGIEYVTTFEAALPGPHVMVSAVDAWQRTERRDRR